MKPSCTLRANEATSAGVRHIASALIGDALCRACRPKRVRPATVHLFRTTTKRLRALLLLIRPAISRTTFERESARLKRIADRLGPLRERTVAIETLKALGHPPKFLRQKILNAGSKAAAADLHPDRALDQAARELDQARARLLKMRIRGDDWNVIGPGLITVYRQARRRMKAAASSQGDLAFHRWRIRVKQLSYQLEWLEPVWPRKFAHMRKRLHRLEECLGRDHDLLALRSLLKKVATESRGDSEIDRVLRLAEKQSRKLQRASERMGVKAFRESPRKFRRDCRKHWESWLREGEPDRQDWPGIWQEPRSAATQSRALLVAKKSATTPRQPGRPGAGSPNLQPTSPCSQNTKSNTRFPSNATRTRITT